jgi:putative ABC transport system ATP-binding protein/lipoprotein-releasing system ATP-binding protein
MPDPAPVEPLVVGTGVGRTFGDLVALDGATFTIPAGARIALVGPSGCGKSTLLHLIAGLDTPTSGALAWPALGPRESLRPLHLGFVFQAPSLVAPLTVVENVELPLLLEQHAPTEARAAALAMLGRIGLPELADKLPEEISGGQAQRVAVARALVHQPALLCADEPTGQLDRATAKHLMGVILAAIEGTSTALVVATHDPEIAARLTTQWSMQHGILNALVLPAGAP